MFRQSRPGRELRDVIYARPAENLAGWQALLGWLRSPGRAGIDRIIAGMETRDRATVVRMKRKAA